MTRLVFDIEANGLRDQPWSLSEKQKANPPPPVSTIHCLCVLDADIGERVERYHDDPEIPRDGTIQEGLERLDAAHTLIGHNIQRYDLPVLRDLRSWEPTPGTIIRDTLVMSAMGYTALADKDARVRPRHLPPSMYGFHSLRAWGYRIGMHKGHVNDTEDWSTFDADMLDYCCRDVEVNAQLFHIFDKGWASKIDEAVQVEHEFAAALDDMEEHGWFIDQDKGWQLVRQLEILRGEMEEELLDLFPPRVVQPTHIANTAPRPDRKADPVGWSAWERWVPNPNAEPSNKWWNPKPNKTTEVVIPFKPGSANHVIWNLNRKYGWEPSKFTKKGNPEFGEEIIDGLGFPETKRLVRYSQVTARLAELVGDAGYLTLVAEDGRVHGRLRHCGAVTHRCTHSRPNTGNVTGVTNRAGVPQFMGREIRELWTVPDDSYCIVGADASGLELRMLGHRMSKHDGGEFAHEVVDGDQHTKNTAIMGLSEWHTSANPKQLRSASKPIIYAHNYGAANERLGETAMPPGAGWSPAMKKRVGALVRKRLLAGLPALKALVSSLKDNWVRGMTITGLDGRVAEVRAAYMALNTQLQMDGAIVIKWATVFLRREATKRWGKPTKDGMWCMVGHVHDEYQFQVKKEIADEFGALATDAITQAGVALSVVCRLDGEFKRGRSWADTH